jgi:hypothetical protein
MSREPQPFDKKILRICEDYSMFHEYKKNTRLTMDLGAEDKKVTDE